MLDVQVGDGELHEICADGGVFQDGDGPAKLGKVRGHVVHVGDADCDGSLCGPGNVWVVVGGVDHNNVLDLRFRIEDVEGGDFTCDSVDGKAGCGLTAQAVRDVGCGVCVCGEDLANDEVGPGVLQHGKCVVLLVKRRRFRVWHALHHVDGEVCGAREGGGTRIGGHELEVVDGDEGGVLGGVDTHVAGRCDDKVVVKLRVVQGAQGVRDISVETQVLVCGGHGDDFEAQGLEVAELRVILLLAKDGRVVICI